MKPIHLTLLILILAVSACGIASPQQAQVLPPASTAALLPSETASPTLAPTATPTWTPTPSPTASLTPTLPAETLPPFLASTPGIAATLTAVYSTPGFRETQAAQQTQVAATQSVLMTSLSGALLTQCPNPSDPPKQEWVNVPVMPQATAGQVVETLIGSYYCFRAPVTVQDVEAFYKDKLQAPAWFLQSDLNGSMTFFGLSPAGIQQVFVLAGPSKANDLIVALNVTRPISLPTPTK